MVFRVCPGLSQLWNSTHSWRTGMRWSRNWWMMSYSKPSMSILSRSMASSPFFCMMVGRSQQSKETTSMPFWTTEVGAFGVTAGNGELESAVAGGEANGKELKIGGVAGCNRVDAGGGGIEDKDGARHHLCQFEFEAHVFAHASAIGDQRKGGKINNPSIGLVADETDVRGAGAEKTIYRNACLASGPLNEGSHWAHLITFYVPF